MGGTGAVDRPGIHAWDENITAHKACGHAQRTRGLDHQYGKVPATSTTAPQRFAGALYALLGAPDIMELLPDSACHRSQRSEEHTSELQSLRHLVCRLLLEKTKQFYIEGEGQGTSGETAWVLWLSANY